MNYEAFSIEKIIEIENDHSILDFKFTFNDFLVWPLVRFYLIQRALEELQGYTNPWDLKTRSFSLGKLAYCVKAFLHNPFRMIKCKSRIIIFGSDIANVKKGKSYFNKLHELFTLEYQRITNVVEQSFNRHFRTPRNISVYYQDWMHILATFFAIGKPVARQDHETIEQFITYIKINLQHQFHVYYDIWDRIRDMLRSYAIKIPIKYRLYRSLFKKTRPKVILVEDGCYGSERAIIIKAAKDLSIHVAEYQHGVISKNHPAYNYGKAVPHSKYLQYMPDDFLCYGPYWKKNCCLPIPIVEIGNPYLEESVKNKKNQINPKKRVILIISGGLDPSRTISNLLRLDEYYSHGEYLIIFRPHPAEYSSLDITYNTLLKRSIIFDTGDLYVTLSKTDILIGEISTVLFEAMAFNINIFMLRSKAAMANVHGDLFNVIDEIDDFIKMMENGTCKKYDSTSLWSPGWRKNYRLYIDKVGAIS